MVVQLSTVLDTSPAVAWTAVKQSATLVYVTRGLLGFAADVFPAVWQEGGRVRTRLFVFGCIPAWTHELHFVRIDDEHRELYTNERGGLISAWNHRIRVAPEADGRCSYTDEVQLQARFFTPLVWFFAHIFYRYRQHRWQRLARSLT